MTDFKFSGRHRATNNTLLPNTFPVGITYRTDLHSPDRVDENCTILHITLDHEALKEHHEEYFGATFQKRTYKVTDFIQFAKDNALTLTAKTSTGANKETLWDGDNSGSSSL